MKHPITLVVLSLAAVLASCRPAETVFPSLPPPTVDGQETIRTADMPRGKAKEYFVVVRLRIASIEVPVGTASGSEEIWSYLDEESIAANRQAVLGRNGIRIGVGRKDSWPDVAKILKRMTAKRFRESTLLARPGSPIPFVLKQGLETQTIFTFHPDRTLTGADYPPGDDLLTMVCTLNEDDPTMILVTGVPQVRSTERKPAIITTLGQPRMAYEPELYAFDALSFQLSIPSEDIIVIGPGAGARRPHSVGHQFLLRDKEGVEFETVLVLIPEVFAAPVKERAAGPAVPEGTTP